MKFKPGDIIKHKTFTNLEVISKIITVRYKWVEAQVIFCENPYLYTGEMWIDNTEYLGKCQKADKIWYLLYG